MKSLHDGNINLIVPSIDYHLTVRSFSALRVYVKKQIVCMLISKQNAMLCHRANSIFSDKANFVTVDVVVIFFIRFFFPLYIENIWWPFLSKSHNKRFNCTHNHVTVMLWMKITQKSLRDYSVYCKLFDKFIL